MIQKQTFNKILIVLTSALALFSWWRVDCATAANSTNNWIIVAAGLSLVFTLISLIMVLVKSAALAELVTFCAIATSIPFAFKISHLVAVIIASLFALIAVRRIRRDFELNVKIDIWKSLRMGKGFLLTAFVLILASQYYVDISKDSNEKELPKLEIGRSGGKIAMQIMATFNPSFTSLQNEEATIDEFILQSWENQQKQSTNEENDAASMALIERQLEENEISQAQREVLLNQAQAKIKEMRSAVADGNKELVLSEGRKQFAQMVGTDISGNEKMADVFSGIVDRKLDDFFAPDPEMPERAKTYPFILSTLLFLSVFSVASILWWFFVAIVAGMFHILVKIGVVKISWVTVEAEIIE